MTADSTDRLLVARAQAGDHAAFEELVERHAARLHAVVRRLVVGDHLAQEVTQESFLRAWRGLSSFKSDAEFSTWLYRIGVNEAHRRLEREMPAAARLTGDASVADACDPAPGPQARLEHSDLRSALERAVGALHPDHRAVLVLRDIEGLSTEQGAEIMGLSEAAFKSRLHRARMSVRNAVSQYL